MLLYISEKLYISLPNPYGIMFNTVKCRTTYYKVKCVDVGNPYIYGAD